MTRLLNSITISLFKRFALIFLTLMVLSTESQALFAPFSAKYQVEIINRYPHNPTSFTQGLVYWQGVMYESVGLRGQSALLKTELKTGRILKRINLDRLHFGEGLALIVDQNSGGKLIQLTYQAQLGFVYDQASLTKVAEFSIAGEGWGITAVDQQLVMTDGSAQLSFLDPSALSVVKTMVVSDDRGPVTRLNELEYVEGYLLANIWKTGLIAVIDLDTGKVVSYIDLSNIIRRLTATAGVANGIAYDSVGQRLFVTGKHWSWLYEIRLIAE